MPDDFGSCDRKSLADAVPFCPVPDGHFIRQSVSNPISGQTTPRSVAAQLGRQPNVASTTREDELLKSQFTETMTRTKRLDAQGDRVGCTGALSAARRMYIL
jgi:hypothetical protein